MATFCLLLKTFLHLLGSLACVPITSKIWGCLDPPIFDRGEKRRPQARPCTGAGGRVGWSDLVAMEGGPGGAVIASPKDIPEDEATDVQADLEEHIPSGRS